MLWLEARMVTMTGQITWVSSSVKQNRSLPEYLWVLSLTWKSVEWCGRLRAAWTTQASNLHLTKTNQYTSDNDNNCQYLGIRKRTTDIELFVFLCDWRFPYVVHFDYTYHNLLSILDLEIMYSSRGDLTTTSRPPVFGQACGYKWHNLSL